jgi:hypothetical protein
MKVPLRGILSSAVFILTTGGSMNLGLAQTNNIIKEENNDYMKDQITQADTLLVEFKRSKSIDQLDAAYVAVGNIPEPGVDKTVPATVARREKARMCFSLLAVIDQNIDTNFYSPNNTNYIIALNLSPAGPKGMKYPSGVAPEDIKEPEVRSQYEAAIKDNEKKKARALFQTRLHKTDQLASIFVERFLRHNYTTSTEDQGELENLMKQAKLSPNRVQAMGAVFKK